MTSSWTSRLVVALLACSATASPFTHRLHHLLARSGLDAPTSGVLARQVDDSEEFQTEVYDNQVEIEDAYSAAQRRVILLDFDGTMVPFQNDPELAVPTAENLEALEVLSSSPYNSVWIISGRDQTFLNKHFGDIPGMGLSAEHGALVREPNGAEWLALADRFDMSWKDSVRAMMDSYTAKYTGARTEEKSFSFSWHYREPETATPGSVDYQALVDELNAAITTNAWDIVVQPGDMVVEVKFTKVSKGNIVRDIVTRSYTGALHEDKAGVKGQVEWLFCAGDDTSDEAMFAALRETADDELDWGKTFSFWVQHADKPDKLTEAKWKLLGPDQTAWNTVPALLSKFAELTVPA